MKIDINEVITMVETIEIDRIKPDEMPSCCECDCDLDEVIRMERVSSEEAMRSAILRKLEEKRKIEIMAHDNN